MTRPPHLPWFDHHAIYWKQKSKGVYIRSICEVLKRRDKHLVFL